MSVGLMKCLRGWTLRIHLENGVWSSMGGVASRPRSFYTAYRLFGFRYNSFLRRTRCHPNCCDDVFSSEGFRVVVRSSAFSFLSSRTSSSIDCKRCLNSWVIWDSSDPIPPNGRKVGPPGPILSKELGRLPGFGLWGGGYPFWTPPESVLALSLPVASLAVALRSNSCCCDSRCGSRCRSSPKWSV
ncbi:hypothetical protein PIB30_060773 [Stylosanthes scabra]|uniref:Uncharacterized protein n=1 Tax=Stylosanthes scabra TaxID=79078 RepID=A0ABU6QKJ5_9FABA|nr:hypothetical protein [Stylosanthes scabra]